MKWLNKIKQIFSPPGKKQENTFMVDDLLFSGPVSLKSPLIREKQMLVLSDFISAVDLIAKTFAKIEFSYNGVSTESGVEINERLYNSNFEIILNRRPNSKQTSTQFKKMIVWDILLKKAFAAYIYRIGGRIVEFIPLESNRVKIQNDDEGNPYYIYILNEEEIILNAKDVLYIDYNSINGYTDVGFDTLHQIVLSLLKNVESVDANITSNTQAFTGVIKVPDNITKAQEEAIRNRFVSMVESARESGSGVLVLDPKWEYVPIDKVDKRDQIVSENFRKDILRRLSRALHIPLGKLGYPEMTANTYKSVSELDLEFIKEAVLPFADDFIATLTKTIIPFNINKKFSYDINNLIKHDLSTLTDMAAKLIPNGILTPNEIRTKYFSFPQKEGGDELLANSAIAPLVDIKARFKTQTENFKNLNNEPNNNNNEKEGEEGG